MFGIVPTYDQGSSIQPAVLMMPDTWFKLGSFRAGELNKRYSAKLNMKETPSDRERHSNSAG